MAIAKMIPIRAHNSSTGKELPSKTEKRMKQEAETASRTIIPKPEIKLLTRVLVFSWTCLPRLA